MGGNSSAVGMRKSSVLPHSRICVEACLFFLCSTIELTATLRRVWMTQELAPSLLREARRRGITSIAQKGNHFDVSVNFI